MNLTDEVLALFDLYGKLGELRNELEASWHSPKRWNVIRRYYRLINPMIIDGQRVNPYGIGLENYLTPIERDLWCEIRCLGLPFYMQYPVGRRFVDFGDPVKRIAIEADGAQWHNERDDAKKDAELGAEGWMVFRVKGRDCFKEYALSTLYGYYGRNPDGSTFGIDRAETHA